MRSQIYLGALLEHEVMAEMPPPARIPPMPAAMMKAILSNVYVGFQVPNDLVIKEVRCVCSAPSTFFHAGVKAENIRPPVR